MTRRALGLVLVLVAACQAVPPPTDQPTPTETQGVAVTQAPSASPPPTATTLPTSPAPSSDGPPTPEPQPTLEPSPSPGPPASRTIEFTTPDVIAPITPRFLASAVWTGAEVIVWGGREEYAGAESMRADGAAYDPARDEWRVIADGPLTERISHLAGWTGSEMLVWGGHEANYIASPGGAAYDPMTDRWREIAHGPLEWHRDGASVWAGSEWVILSTDPDGPTRVAAYDPMTDTWRSLPRLPESGHPIWTGEELVVSAGNGLYRLGPGASDWEAAVPNEITNYVSPVWTGEQLIGIHRDRLMAWDATSGTWSELPSPPFALRYPQLVWADGKVILDGRGLVFDLQSREWWTMGNPSGTSQPGADILWAGDRLFVWGGGRSNGHFQEPEPYPNGYVLIPDW